MSGWWGWLAHGHEEFPRARQPVSRSPVIWVVAAVFWVSRRLSPLEHWKRARFTAAPGGHPVPAAVTDAWVLAWLLASTLALALADRVPDAWRPFLGWSFLFLAVQKFLHDAYHLVWRWLVHPEYHVHAVVRSLVHALLSYVQLLVFFAGCACWALGDGITQGDTTLREAGPLAAFYYSATIGTTLGLGDFVPTAGAARAVVALEVVLCLMLFGVLLGRTVGSLKALEERD